MPSRLKDEEKVSKMQFMGYLGLLDLPELSVSLNSVKKQLN